MTVIRLSGPLASASAQERLALFAGRALGEDEFDRAQRYADGRVAPLLVGQGPGIVRGLGLRLSAAGGADLVIEPGVAIARDGLAVVLDGELRPRWCDLRLPSSSSGTPGARLVALPPAEAAELGESEALAAPDGFYALALERVREELSLGTSEPERRTELDPLLDRQRQLVARVVVHPLSIPGVTLATPPLRAANRACALLVPLLGSDAPLAELEQQAIILGLVAVEGGSVAWADALALRRTLGPGAAGRALAEQCRAAMEAALREIPLDTPEADLASAFAAACPLDFLPPAGQLPALALRAAAEVAGGGNAGPELPFLAPHLGVELVPVRLGDVPALLASELPRGPIARTRATGERVRLLLAVRDADWRANLCDVPRIDASALDNLHRAWVVAIEAWVAWKRARNARDFAELTDDLARLPGEPQVTLDAAQRAALGLAQPDAPQPRPEGPPASAGGLGLVQGILERERAETEAGNEPRLPRPYDDPPPQAVYTIWAERPENAAFKQRGELAVTAVPLVNASSGLPLGAIPELALQRRFRAALLADVAEVESIVERYRDHVHEHRQQLDAHTVNLAAVAGGVAADGSGLKIARWLPYVNFNAKPTAKTLVASETAPALTTREVGQPQAPAPAQAARPAQAGFVASGELASVTSAGFFSAGLLQPQAPSLNIVLPAQKVEKDLSANMLSQLVDQFNAIDLPTKERPPVKPPAYVAEEAAFGVMRHVRPDVYVLDEALGAYRALYDRLATRLAERDLPTWKTRFAATELDRLRALQPELRANFDRLRVEALQESFKGSSPDGEDALSKSYRKSVFMGQRHVDLVDVAEGARGIWERLLRVLVAELERVAERIDVLEAALPAQHRAVASTRSALDEAMEDYAMAQRLLVDDWERVEQLDEQRNFALTHPLGVWFVRARRVPSASPVPDPLQLRPLAAGDVVPGCGDAHDDLPEVLDQFLDLVREAPLAAFPAFVALVDALPESARLLLLGNTRGVRLAAKSAAELFAVPRLSGLVQSRAALLSSLRGIGFELAPSVSETRRRALLALSMEDLLAGPPSAARQQAERFRSAWEQATGCLVAGLRRLPAGIRYSWAQAAEDDRLPLTEPGLWPELAQAESAVGTAAARTLVELVVWMFRQLQTGAGDHAQNAVRLLLRACLVHVAHGEASELLTGRITVAAARLATGVVLRAELSREAKMGTRLHLLDASRRVVGTVRVDDRDPQGTLVRVIERQVDVEPSTLFTLAAIRS